jgi:hypothetical protein
MSSQQRTVKHWTFTQMQDLIDYVEHHGRHWRSASTHFNHHFTPLECRNKWEGLKRYSIRWTPEDDDELVAWHDQFASENRIPWRRFREDVSGAEAKNRYYAIRRRLDAPRRLFNVSAEEFWRLIRTPIQFSDPEGQK